MPFIASVVMHADDALVETYQDFPPWGLHGGWNEVLDAAGSLTPVQVELNPGFSDHECGEALHLYAPELTERCIHGKRQADGSYQTRHTFDELLAAGTGPTTCGYDCCAKWHEYSEDCADFLGRNHPGLAGFTALCTATHQTMSIYDIDGNLPEHGHDDHFFNAEQVNSRAVAPN